MKRIERIKTDFLLVMLVWKLNLCVMIFWNTDLKNLRNKKKVFLSQKAQKGIGES